MNSVQWKSFSPRALIPKPEMERLDDYSEFIRETDEGRLRLDEERIEAVKRSREERIEVVKRSKEEKIEAKKRRHNELYELK